MPRLLAALGLALLAALITACADRSDRGLGGLPPELTEDIRAIVDDAAQETVGGVLVRIDTADGAFETAAGLPEVTDEQTPAFRVASITKLFTAAVLLQLDEEEALDIDDPVVAVLPDRAEAFYHGEDMTVRHLLGHTSGLPDYLRNPAYWVALLERATITDGAVTAGCEDLADVDPLSFVDPDGSFEPGDGYEYSNAGYALAGHIIEAVDGRPLADVYRERVIEPLGLDRTWLACAEDPRADLVPAYHAAGSFGVTIPGQGSDPYEVTEVHDPNLWAAGGLVSTAEDVAVFARALFSGDLFEETATLDEMLSTTVEDSYGLGVEVGDGGYGHGGLAPGYGSHLRFDPDTGAVVVVMINETAVGLPAAVGARVFEALDEHGL